jgi:frataxin-like iron-binding protein CyaY
VDPDGRDLEFTSDNKKNIKETIKMMNEFIGGRNVFGFKDGKVTAKKLSEKRYNKLSDEQKAFYDNIYNIAEIEDRIVSIGIDNNTDVFIGSFEKEKIDIGDILKLGNGKGLNKFTAFIHEIAEQTAKQLDKQNGIHHDIEFYHDNYGIPVENSVSGYERDPRTNLSWDVINGTVIGVYTFNFHNATENFLRVVRVYKGNIIGIK